jgi:exodeoxyribonuclease-3
MRITTWNVNGIRAAINKGLPTYMRSIDPDVLCLQEVKARPEQVGGLDDHLDGYQRYWNAAQRPGYSGVATFTRRHPAEVTYQMGIDKFDQEGRIIRTHFPKFVLYNVYFPSGQRGRERVDFKLEFYAELLKEIDDLHRQCQQVVICGDFNTAHQEIDLTYPKANKLTSGFLPEERARIDAYLSHGLVDAFRVLYPEKVQYTWWTYRLGARGRNIGWRLDYFLVSAGMMDNVREVSIHDDVPGSDHCPVSLILSDNCA